MTTNTLTLDMGETVEEVRLWRIRARWFGKQVRFMNEAREMASLYADACDERAEAMRAMLESLTDYQRR